MSESAAESWATIVLILLFLVPFVSFSLLFKLHKQYSYSLLVTVTNKVALLYTAIVVFMILVVLGKHPLIDDPEYPDPDEILTGGIIIGFCFYYICVFLPLLLIVNLIRKFFKEKPGTNTTD